MNKLQLNKRSISLTVCLIVIVIAAALIFRQRYTAETDSLDTETIEPVGTLFFRLSEDGQPAEGRLFVEKGCDSQEIDLIEGIGVCLLTPEISSINADPIYKVVSPSVEVGYVYFTSRNGNALYSLPRFADVKNNVRLKPGSYEYTAQVTSSQLQEGQNPLVPVQSSVNQSPGTGQTD